jgi:hypothetical protein
MKCTVFMTVPLYCRLPFNVVFTANCGRAIAQAVSRWLPNAAARVRARVWSSGIYCGQSGTEAGFLRTSVSPANLYSIKFSILTLTRGRYNRPEVADIPSGPNLDSTPHYAN